MVGTRKPTTIKSILRNNEQKQQRPGRGLLSNVRRRPINWREKFLERKYNKVKAFQADKYLPTSYYENAKLPDIEGHALNDLVFSVRSQLPTESSAVVQIPSSSYSMHKKLDEHARTAVDEQSSKKTPTGGSNVSNNAKSRTDKSSALRKSLSLSEKKPSGRQKRVATSEKFENGQAFVDNKLSTRKDFPKTALKKIPTVTETIAENRQSAISDTVKNKINARDIEDDKQIRNGRVTERVPTTEGKAKKEIIWKLSQPIEAKKVARSSLEQKTTAAGADATGPNESNENEPKGVNQQVNSKRTSLGAGKSPSLDERKLKSRRRHDDDKPSSRLADERKLTATEDVQRDAPAAKNFMVSKMSGKHFTEDSVAKMIGKHGGKNPIPKGEPPIALKKQTGNVINAEIHEGSELANETADEEHAKEKQNRDRSRSTEAGRKYGKTEKETANNHRSKRNNRREGAVTSQQRREKTDKALERNVTVDKIDDRPLRPLEFDQNEKMLKKSADSKVTNGKARKGDEVIWSKKRDGVASKKKKEETVTFEERDLKGLKLSPESAGETERKRGSGTSPDEARKPLKSGTGSKTASTGSFSSKQRSANSKVTLPESQKEETGRDDRIDKKLKASKVEKTVGDTAQSSIKISTTTVTKTDGNDGTVTKVSIPGKMNSSSGSGSSNNGSAKLFDQQENNVNDDQRLAVKRAIFKAARPAPLSYYDTRDRIELMKKKKMHRKVKEEKKKLAEERNRESKRKVARNPLAMVGRRFEPVSPLKKFDQMKALIRRQEYEVPFSPPSSGPFVRYGTTTWEQQRKRRNDYVEKMKRNLEEAYKKPQEMVELSTKTEKRLKKHQYSDPDQLVRKQELLAGVEEEIPFLPRYVKEHYEKFQRPPFRVVNLKRSHNTLEEFMYKY